MDVRAGRPVQGGPVRLPQLKEHGMAKQGQHHNDGNDPEVSRGHNNPRKSTPITTGSPKKRATYAREAREHRDTAPQPQHQTNEWHEQTPRSISKKDLIGDSSRTGSDSDESRKTRGD